ISEPLAMMTPRKIVKAQYKTEDKNEETYGWHWVLHDGLRVCVWSTPTDHGTYSWDNTLPENVAAIKEAKRKAAAEKKDVIENEEVGGSLKPSPSAPEAQAKKRMANGGIAYDYGVDQSKFGRGGYNGIGPAAEQFIQQEAPGPAKGPLRLTVIGPKENRREVIDDLSSNSELKSLSGSFQVQEYDPGSWAVDPSLGFDVKGKPTILLQRPDGKVLYRRTDYKEGPNGIIQAIRKADPNYDPKKDPGPGGGPHTPGMTKEQWLGIFAIAIILFSPGKSRSAQ
ncbi:MAG TPA: hypothetical protein VES58_06705, partial [Syntrophobacteria bacterium]|nr:hypothetical protein [Syntrophobacteria bacterium]